MKRCLILLTLLFQPLLYGVTTGPFITISAAGNNGPPQVAVSDGGNALAVWTAFPNQIFVAFFNITTAAWSSPILLATGTVPQVGIDGSGNALVVWVTLANQINISRFNVTTMSFSAAVQLSNVNTTNNAPRISVNRQGTALIIWIQSTPSFQVLATSLNPTTLAFTTPVSFLANTNPASFALDNLNTGIAIWQSFPTAVIQAARIFVP